MNFGIVNQWYPLETAGGGVATYNLNLAHELRTLGHSVVVVTSTRQPAARREFDGDIPVYRIPRPRISTRWDRHLPLLGRYMRLLRTLIYARRVHDALKVVTSRHDLDVLEYADIEAEAFFHDKDRFPRYGIRLHGPLFSIEPYYRGKEKPYGTTLLKAMEKKAILNAAVLTSPTRAFAELVCAEYGMPTSRVLTVPHFLSADTCGWVKTPGTGRDPVILFVGRLEYKKGADVFADAIQLVSPRYPRAKFVFLAHDRPQPDGRSTKESLQRQLRAAGVLDRVQFVTAAATSGCFYAALQPDVCVVPSRFEAFSFPTLESMAHGVPVVASRVCGIPEVVEDGLSGLLFPVENVEALAQALGTLLADSKLRGRLGLAGREHATRQFRAGSIAKEIASIYMTREGQP